MDPGEHPDWHFIIGWDDGLDTFFLSVVGPRVDEAENISSGGQETPADAIDESMPKIHDSGEIVNLARRHGAIVPDDLEDQLRQDFTYRNPEEAFVSAEMGIDFRHLLRTMLAPNANTSTERSTRSSAQVNTEGIRETSKLSEADSVSEMDSYRRGLGY